MVRKNWFLADRFNRRLTSIRAKVLLPDFLGPLMMHIGTDAKSVSALGVESAYAASHDGGSIKGRTSLELSDISRTK